MKDARNIHFDGEPSTFAQMRTLFTRTVEPESRWRRLWRWFCAAYQEARTQQRHVIGGRPWF
jgi:hypothetical protein